MNIAIAQTRSVNGNIAASVTTHRDLIGLAIEHSAAAIFFPELSLTGYEPRLAAAHATGTDDPMISDFRKISNRHHITISMGMPTKTAGGVRISMILFQPGKSIQIYSKQQLHGDETPFFVSGSEQLLLQVHDKKVAPAICYESLQWNHSENAYNLGADIYIASVAKSQTGVDKALAHFPAVAQRFLMPVLMANCIGACDNFISAGQSAVWTRKGVLAGQLDSEQEGILIFDTEKEKVTAVNYRSKVVSQDQSC